MGYPVNKIRRIRSAAVGTAVGKYDDDSNTRSILTKLNPQPKLQARQEAILARYIDDMRQAVCETARVLASGGQAVYVVGENTVYGTFIHNSLIMEELANSAGLQCTAKRSRELPANRRYLPPPSARCHGARLADAPRGGNHTREDIARTPLVGTATHIGFSRSTEPAVTMGALVPMSYGQTFRPCS